MKIFLGLFALLLCSAGIAQDAEWKLYKTVEGVEIYTMESDCDVSKVPAQKAFIIKIVNTTGNDITIEWDRVLWYNDQLETKNVADDENHFVVEVKKNSSVEGSCETPRGPFYIFKDFITYKSDTKLTKFELQNIKVTRS